MFFTYQTPRVVTPLCRALHRWFVSAERENLRLLRPGGFLDARVLCRLIYECAQANC